MVGTIFKTLGFFFICFMVLCIPINNKTLFDHLFRASRPVGKIISESAEAGLKKSQKYGKKFFLNSNPTMADQDEVRSVNSAAKKIHKTSRSEETLDHYSTDETAALNKTIEQNN